MILFQQDDDDLYCGVTHNTPTTSTDVKTNNPSSSDVTQNAATASNVTRKRKLRQQPPVIQAKIQKAGEGEGLFLKYLYIVLPLITCKRVKVDRKVS